MPHYSPAPPGAAEAARLAFDASVGYHIPYTSAKLWLGPPEPCDLVPPKEPSIDCSERLRQIRKKNKMPMYFRFQ